MKVDDGINVEKVRVSLCLERRLDVCSMEIAAKASSRECCLVFYHRIVIVLVFSC